MITQMLFGGGVGTPTDPSFSSVQLLLHMDGTNGSTTFTDSSSAGRTVSVGGNAQISTTDAKWGTGCLITDGTGDYISVADAASLEPSGTNWTIEGWYRPASLAATATLVTKRANGTSYGPFTTYVDTSGKLGGLTSQSGTSWEVNILSSSAVFTVGVWTHWAYVRNTGNVFTLYADGNRVATATNAISHVNNAVAVSVGANADGSTCANGKHDDVRITLGVSRYSGATYTVPSAPFPNL